MIKIRYLVMRINLSFINFKGECSKQHLKWGQQSTFYIIYSSLQHKIFGWASVIQDHSDHNT